MIVDIEDEDVPELSNASDILCDEVMDSVYQEFDEPTTSTTM